MSDNGDLGWITNYIWGIADDVLRDLYVRGKYRDVILPMTVLRRLGFQQLMGGFSTPPAVWRTRGFDVRQHEYLAYHRSEIFVA